MFLIYILTAKPLPVCNRSKNLIHFTHLSKIGYKQDVEDIDDDMCATESLALFLSGVSNREVDLTLIASKAAKDMTPQSVVLCL